MGWESPDPSTLFLFFFVFQFLPPPSDSWVLRLVGDPWGSNSLSFSALTLERPAPKNGPQVAGEAEPQTQKGCPAFKCSFQIYEVDPSSNNSTEFRLIRTLFGGGGTLDITPARQVTAPVSHSPGPASSFIGGVAVYPRLLGWKWPHDTS